MSDTRNAPSRIVTSLLEAYRRGFFPMADDSGPFLARDRPRIHWFSPDPRGILPLTPLEGFHVARRLESTIRRNRFILRVDTAFELVIRACAQPRRTGEDDDDDPPGTWIDDTIVAWYHELHLAGHAHSLEAWAIDPATKSEALVGGIYGVSIGSAFFGESMFHIARPRLDAGTRHPLDGTDASKVCLVTLVRALAAAGYTLFDTQMVTAHVARFGGISIPRKQYLTRLERAVAVPDRWPSVTL